MKTVLITKTEAIKWYEIANMFAKGSVPLRDAIREYNRLSVAQKIEIRKEFKDFDILRGVGMDSSVSLTEKENHWIVSVMVDSHIVATEYDTYPVVVLMCIKPPCRLDQHVFTKPSK